MQGDESGSITLTLTLGSLEATVRGPLREATALLLEHLQRFPGEASVNSSFATPALASPKADLEAVPA